ncbi:MAG: hypothetical protein ACRDNW_11090 [Trebonia sp.]
MPGPVDELGYRRPPATIAYDDLRRQGLPPVMFAHTFLPEGVTIFDVRGFAALIEQAHHDRALLTHPDGEDGAVLCRGFPNNGLAEWRIVNPDQPTYTWPLHISAERDGHHLCTFLPASPPGSEPVATPPVTFTIRAEAGDDGDGGAVPFGPMNGMGYRRPPATVAFAELRRRGLPEVVLTHLSLPEGATACDLDSFAAMIEDAYRTPGTLHAHPDLDADGNEQCIGIGAERAWRWEMARRPEPADDGEYYGGLHEWVARLLLAPERDGTRQGTVVPHAGGAREPADPGPVTFTIRVRPEAGDAGDALSRLDGDAPPAAALLRALVFLEPEPLPFSLLLGVPKATDASVMKGTAPETADVPLPEAAAALGVLLGDPIASGDAIHLLRRHELLAWARGDGEVVPPQVRAAVRATLETSTDWQLTAAALVDAAIPADPRDPKSWPAFAALLPHARAVIATTSDAMTRFARYLGESGDYRGARDLWSLIADTRAADGDPAHPRTVAARCQHARWTGAAGDAVTARDALAALLPLAEDVLGPDHPDTLAARHQLASMTGFAGDPFTAREQLLMLVPAFERILGLDHLDTLRARASLAHWTGAAGDPADALHQFGLLSRVTERVFGNLPHPETLRMQVAAVPWYGKGSHPHTARNVAGLLLTPYLGRVFGPAHPDTLRTRRERARWTGLDGDPAAARDELAELLPLMESTLGPDHPRTVAARRDLTSWTEQADMSGSGS